MEKMRELSNEEMAKISGGARCISHLWRKEDESAHGEEWVCQICGAKCYRRATDNGEIPAPVPGPVPNT